MSEELKIRFFEAADADTCFRIRSEAFVRIYYDHLGPESVAHLINSYMPADFVLMSRRMSWFVAEEAGQAVGFCTFNYLDESTAEVLFLYVQLDHRGKGIGARLLRHSEEWLRTQRPEVTELVLDTVHPEYNQHFYEKMGFSVICSRAIERSGSQIQAVQLGKSLR